MVDFADVDAFLVVWFNDLSAGTSNADYDASGVTNSLDIGAFINAWFENAALGCG